MSLVFAFEIGTSDFQLLAPAQWELDRSHWPRVKYVGQIL